MRSVYTQSFEHLNKVGVGATMDSLSWRNRDLYIYKKKKILLLEGEKPCHIFQRLQKFSLKHAYPIQPLSFTEKGGQEKCEEQA